MTGIEESMALMAVSTVVGAAGAISQGNAQAAAGAASQKASEYQAMLRESQAKALEQRAGQERASAQRAAATQRKQGNLVSSRARALAAASGGDTLDPTVTNIMAGIENETDYRALTALYQGDATAQGLEYNATLQRAGATGDVYAGQVARNAGNAARGTGYLKAGAGLFEGASKTILSQGTGLARYAEADPFTLDSYATMFG